MNWISTQERLPERNPEMDYGDEYYTNEVLFTNGKEQWIGNAFVDVLNIATWHMKGRDGYIVYGVTHWKPLDPL